MKRRNSPVITPFPLLPSKPAVCTDSFALCGVHRRNPPSEFFDTYGFVVVRDILTPAECESTIAEIMTAFETSTFGDTKWDRTQPETWNRWPSEGMEQY